MIYRIITFLVGLILGAVATFWLFKRYLKNNPPINEGQIKEIFRQAGRTPSEKKIKQIMESIQKLK